MNLMDMINSCAIRMRQGEENGGLVGVEK